MNSGNKVKFYVERTGFGVEAMVILMALSVVFRIIGCWGLWTDSRYAALQIALPVFSALLLIAVVWLFGKKALWLSFFPVLLGAVFFIIKSIGFESLIHTILCIVLYVAVIVLYFCTVFGIIRTKWILVLLFGLPFLYHVFVEDLAALQDTANPVTFAAGMQEMGVLCIMLGLFFLSLSMKKTVREPEAELPKMKDPKVLRPEKSEQSPEAVSSETADASATVRSASAAASGGSPSGTERPTAGASLGTEKPFVPADEEREPG